MTDKRMKKRQLLATLGVSLLCALALLHCGSSGNTSSDNDIWSWLGENGGTYWYVPTENLEAIKWDPSSPTNYSSIEDQTVWHIESYDNGYFFGPAVVKFAGYPRTCQYMIGSVTPSGQVYISFNSTQEIPTENPSITTGTGSMVQQSRAWTFNMQMASGTASLEVSHWAFMLQCTAQQSCWNDIPGTDLTISELLASCE